jgi:hypothetical protein
MRGAILLLPQYIFVAWCLFRYRNKFTFTLTFTGTFREFLFVFKSQDLESKSEKIQISDFEIV